MKKKNLWIYVSIICIISIIVFFYMYMNKTETDIFSDGKDNGTKEDELGTQSQEVKELTDRSINTWTVYWDNEDVLQDILQLGSKVTSLSYFAAYFDANENPFIPDNIVSAHSSVELAYSDPNYKSYLTFVNDVLKAEGGSSLKDTKLLYSLLSSPGTRQNHINQIIEMTINGGYDGVEIDYEGMKKDKDLWILFIKFIDELYIAASDRGLLVRVLLEPNALTYELDFPNGPEYVMMCYNLYGYGTKPGPKANKDFLTSMVKKMSIIPGEKGFAVANGGFDFDESGKVKQISTKDAIKLQESNQASSYRDKESGCMVFTYKDDLGSTHEVWYADNVTIDYWFTILEELGEENLYLWRLSG